MISDSGQVPFFLLEIALNIKAAHALALSLNLVVEIALDLEVAHALSLALNLGIAHTLDLEITSPSYSRSLTTLRLPSISYLSLRSMVI